MKKKFVLFSEIYNPNDFDKQPLPDDIYNSEGAALAHKGHKLSKERLLNAYIYIDDVFVEKKIYKPGDETGKTDIPSESGEEIKTKPSTENISDPITVKKEQKVLHKTYTPSYDPGFELSDKYEEEPAEAIDKRLIDLDFEPIPKIKTALRSNIYNLKEVFKKKIVNNVASLNSMENEKLTGIIADYLESIIDINMYASDYIDMITAIRTKDNYITFAHACSVAFYTLAIAKKLKMLREDLVLNNNIGRWIPLKTKKHDKAHGSLPISNQMLKYIDYQKSNIMLKYDNEVKELLYEYIHDLMFEYSLLKPETNYPSLRPSYDEQLRRTLTMAALNIDIGKLFISNNILNKSEKLTPQEWIELKKHPVYSVSKLREVEVNNPKMFAYIIGHHMLDKNNSYPEVKGTPPPETSVISVADIYDAMTSPKHYGQQATQATALEFFKSIYDRGLIDYPLYLTSVHTFQEYNHEYVRRRHKRVAEETEEEQK